LLLEERMFKSPDLYAISVKNMNKEFINIFKGIIGINTNFYSY